MSEITTIYFDTSFFIWLAKATEAQFKRAMARLNELGVRYVRSDYVLLELLSGVGRSEQDEQLVRRVQEFAIEPLVIPFGTIVKAETGLSWETLLTSDAERLLFAQQLHEIFDLETAARSFSNLADSDLSSSHHQKLLNSAVEPFHEAVGITETSTDAERTDAYLSFAMDLVSKLSDVLPPEMQNRLSRVQHDESLQPREAIRLSQEFLSVIGPDALSKLKSEGMLINSTVALDPRPLDVALKRATEKSFRKLGNTFRDANHMMVFSTNSNEINFLHVDRAQLALITRAKPVHRLKQGGLHSRCFAAANLSEILEKIAALITV